MPESPFITPQAELGAQTETSAPALWQPYAVVAALFLLGLTELLADTFRHWYGGLPIGQLLGALPGLLGPWLSSLLPGCALVVLFMHAQRERHGILSFRPIAVIVIVFLLIRGVAMAWLDSTLVSWAQEFALWLGDTANLMGLVTPLAILGGVAVHATMCLLPLWLVLLATRSRCVRQPWAAALPIDRRHVAIGVALGFAGVTAKLLSGLVRLFLLNKAGTWGFALEILAWAIPSGLVLFLVWRELPATVPRFAARRVLLAALTIGLGWLACVSLVGLLGYGVVYPPLMRAQALSGLPLVALVSVLAALLLLASWASLGARWLPGRKGRAQSSPR